MLKPSLHTSNRGFSIFELMLSSTLGLIVIAMAASTVVSSRSLFQQDLVRTRLNQSIRGASHTVGLNIRRAGNYMPRTVPPIELSNGASGASDELILRRALIPEVLKLCSNLVSGSTGKLWFTNAAGSTTGCGYPENTSAYSAWDAKLTFEGSTGHAFIYDPTSGNGEVFRFTTMTDTSSNYYITRADGSWANTYLVGATAIYFIEELNYKLTHDFLYPNSSRQLLSAEVNGDSSDPNHVAYGVTDFQAEIVMKDGSTKTSFTNADDWTEIASIELSLWGEDNYKQKIVSTELSSSFFPRNVISK